MRKVILAAVLVCFLTQHSFAWADARTGERLPSTDWPWADGRNLPIRWSRTENIAWSAKLPGWGTSSPVVYGDRVFVTSQDGQAGKKSLLTLCFERTTGREIWRHDFGFGFDQHTHEKSNLAPNTPTVTDDALYVLFGNAEMARYSHDGELQWVTRMVPMFGDPKTAWGWGISPVLLQDVVLFPWDHHAGPCYLLGIDKATGNVAWKLERPIGTGHATCPLVLVWRFWRIVRWRHREPLRQGLARSRRLG